MRPGTFAVARHLRPHETDIQEALVGKGILLWLVGVPIPVIILLFACHVIH